MEKLSSWQYAEIWLNRVEVTLKLNRGLVHTEFLSDCTLYICDPILVSFKPKTHVSEWMQTLETLVNM